MVRKRIVAIILAAAVAGMSYSAYAMDCEEQIVSEEIVTEEISENEMPEEETADISEETVEAAEESIESGDSDAPETQSDVTLSSNSVTYGSVTLSVNASYCTYTDQNGYYALVYTSNMGTLTTKGTLNIQHTSDVRYEYFGSKLLPGKYSYVVVDGVPYSYGNDYKVSFKNNKHAGEMTITVKFKKNTTPYSNGIKKIVETVTITPGPMELKDLDIYFNGTNTKVVKILNNYTGKKIPKKYYTVDMNTRTVTMKGDYTGGTYF